MSLVQPLAHDHDAEIRELALFFQETLGFPPNSVLTMQRRPAIAKAFIALNKAVMSNEGRLNSEQKRLIAYLTSANTGCRYCQAHTALAAQRFGATQERLDSIWLFRDSPLFSEAEKVAFEFALAASSVPNAVDEALSNRLHDYWNDGEIVEMLGVIALFGFLNRWNDSMSTTLEAAALASANTLLVTQGWSVGKHK